MPFTRCSISRRSSSQETIANASALASLPIVTVNLWFDRAVMHEPLVGLPGRNFQWVFDRRAIVGGAASHLSLISSGAETIVSMSNDELAAMALGEVREALPDARAATVQQEPRGSREALDVFACRRCAAAAADPHRDRGLPPRRRLDRHRTAGDDRVGGDVRPSLPLRRWCQRMTAVLVHYSEVALKGKNRSWFVGRLVRNIHGALAGLHIKEVRTPIGRIEIVLGQDTVMPEVLDRLSRIFGIANYSVATRVPLDFEGMADAIVSRLPPQESVDELSRVRAALRSEVRRCRRRSWRAISARACGRRAAGRSISIMPIW